MTPLLKYFSGFSLFLDERWKSLMWPLCCCSAAKLCLTPCNPMDCSTPGFFVLYHLPELAQTSIESVIPSNHFILCGPLHLLSSIFPSIRVFSNESVLQIRWPKYWSFSLNTVTKEYLVRVYYAYKSSSRTGRFKIQRLMWNAGAWSYKMTYGDCIGFSDGRGLV